MLKPRELISLLIDTAGAISKVDFNNASNRQAYMKLERMITENLPIQAKKFMVQNVGQTPFDNEQIKIEGDMYALKELVGGMKKGGPVKQNSIGILPMNRGEMVRRPVMSEPSIVSDPNAPQDPITGAPEDTVNTELQEGTFIINTAAVAIAGKEDIRKMVMAAVDAAERDGTIVVPTSEADRVTQKEKLVDVVLGDGEVVIPKELVSYIGLDRLQKINNRGKAQMAKAEAEAQKQGVS